MFCPKCGKEMSNDARFCPYCAYKLPKTTRKRYSNTKKHHALVLCVVVVIMSAFLGWMIWNFIHQVKEVSEESKIFEMGETYGEDTGAEIVKVLETESEDNTKERDTGEREKGMMYVAVNFALHDEGIGNVWADIDGTDESGNVIWSISTEQYIQTEPLLLTAIGQFDDAFYFAENYRVKKISAITGELIWETVVLDGMPLEGVVGDDGRVYVTCGYLEPEFCAIDEEGNVLCEIDHFDEDYYGIEIKEYNSGKVYMTASSPDEEYILLEIDAYTFEWKRV